MQAIGVQLALHNCGIKPRLLKKSVYFVPMLALCVFFGIFIDRKTMTKAPYYSQQ